MTPVGTYDPDWVAGNQSRPAWAVPKTPIAIEALRVCGRSYFRGQTKHNSEFALWEEQERKIIGASDECFLQRAWIKNVIEWAREKNKQGTIITFPVLLKMIADDDRRIDFMGINRERLLKARKNNIPEFAKRIEVGKSTLQRILQESEESDE
jgi:hypothetical protein